MKTSYYKFGLLGTWLIFASLLLTSSAISQVKASDGYLIVRFDRFYDNTNQRAFYSINAERGCDKASTIYSLLKYDAKKNAENTKGSFYASTRMANDNLYNYFLSPTEGLNFMAALEWQLVSTFSETTSDLKMNETVQESWCQ